MSPPLPARPHMTDRDRITALETKTATLESGIKDARAAARKSAEDGKFELERNMAAIAIATASAEGRDQQLAKEIHVLRNQVHGVVLEQARQGAEIKRIDRNTSTLGTWFAHPAFRLALQAFTAIAAAYAAAAAASHPTTPVPEPAHTAAPMHP